MKLKTKIFLLSIWTVGVYRLAAQTNVFPTNGYVGIGTTAPQTSLHLQSSALYTPQILLESTNPTAGSGSYIILQKTKPSPTTFATGDILGTILANGNWNGVTQQTSYLSFLVDAPPTPNLQSALVFVSRNADGSSTEKVRFASNGNVGIGTTSPDKPLHVSYDSSSVPAIKIGSGTDAQGWYTFLGNDPGGATTSYIGNAYNNDAAVFQIRMKGTGSASARLTVLGSGNVGIGTVNPTQKLSVNGTIRAKEVIVDTNWSDYVFAKNYRLASLFEVEQQIQQQGHLPGVPSADEVAKKGLSIGDLQSILLAKIEELTLHQIAQEKRLASQEAKIEAQTAEIARLKKDGDGAKQF